VSQHEDKGEERKSAEAAESQTAARRTRREFYGEIAAGGVAKAPLCCVTADAADALDGAYAGTDIHSVPRQSMDLALGCGNPVALATLEPGQIVLDLGCGGGLDCFLAAGQVGESGFVIGVDMTPEMLQRAREAQRQTGFRNVEFRLGEIEHLPVADRSVDVVISNCVISMAPDKAQVFREANRVLRPGGVLAVSDMMIGAPLPQPLRAALGPLADTVCVEGDYLAAIEAAGFVDIEVVRRDFPHASREHFEKSPAEGGHGARAIVQIGETGETRTVDLDPAMLSGTMGSFSGKVRAHKPL